MSEFLLKTENRYSGIPTIRREMAAAGLPEPVFINRRNEFIVILYNERKAAEKAAPQTQDMKEPLLEFCRTPKTRREIADYLGINTVFYAMQHYVQPLLENGKLEMTIPEKPKSRNQKYVAK